MRRLGLVTQVDPLRVQLNGDDVDAPAVAMHDFSMAEVGVTEVIVEALEYRRFAWHANPGLGGAASIEQLNDEIDRAMAAEATKVSLADLPEAVQDIVGAALVAGSNITVAYDDTAGTVTIASTAPAGLTQEQVEDFVGAMATDSSTIDFTYDDPAGTITAVVKPASITTSMLAFDVATQTELDAAINGLINSAPGTLDTLGEIAAQLAVDESAAAALTTAVNARVTKALFDANTILKADTDDTPVALTVAASRLVGRAASGGVDALTAAQVKTLLALAIADLSDSDLLERKLRTTTTQTGTAYTLVLADAATTVETNNTAANTLTVPPNSTAAYPVGTVIRLRQYGSGQTTVVPGSGVTVRSRGGALRLDGRYAEAALVKRATDEWVLTGTITTTVATASLLTDTYTRADSASSLGVADTGQAYTTSGTWGISSNQAYCVALSGGNAYAVLDSGFTDHDMQATLAGTLAGNPGVVARYTDLNNFLRLIMLDATHVRLDQQNGGTFSILGTSPGLTFSATPTFRIVVTGTTVNCYVDGVLVITATTAVTSGTKGGLFHNAVNAVRFDNLTLQGL